MGRGHAIKTGQTKPALPGRRKVRLIILGLILLFFLTWFWFCLPRKLFKDPLSAVLLDEQGRLSDTRIAGDGQWRFPRYGHIPERYLEALIQFEDSRFYYHPGIDALALGRALVKNIKSGKRTSGGSTLTMQVIRLSRKNPPRTYFEKLKEMILALRLELRCSKKEILELYAANAPFGGNIVGLEAASWFYFGRAPGRLSWAESALLAVLPNSPALIHPGKNREKLKQKRNTLLLKLKNKKIINELDYTLSIIEPLPQKPHPFPRLAPHLLGTLLDDSPLKKAGDPLFHTTLIGELQIRAGQICRDHARSLMIKDIRNLACIIIDNRESSVVAYIGNTGHLDRNRPGSFVDIVKSPRSTGSILKPFLYAAMLKSGEITPNTLIPDVPTQFSGFIPENFDRSYRGAVPAREALAQSLNIPAVHMLHRYGVPRFYDFLEGCGVSTLHRQADDYGLTLILGGAEGTLFEITSLYAKLAQGADQYRDKIFEIRVLKDQKNRPAAPDLMGGAAYLTLQALLEVARPGAEGHWRNFSSSKSIAWKTGTSYGLRDAWAIGVTPRYTVGVWAGNADGEGKAGLTGASVAAPLLFDLFNTLDTGGWFEIPLLNLKEITLCRDSGNRATELCPKIEVYVPRESHFTSLCNNHRLVHLDKSGLKRVDSSCESTENMIHKSWFVLTPVQEFYYSKYHPEYKPLPPFRPDCRQSPENSKAGRIMNLVYPQKGTAVYVPVDLDGKRSRVVFSAVHREKNIKIYWHLDDRYMGTTEFFHEMPCLPGPGYHILTLVDEKGNRLQRRFQVLDKKKDK